MPAPRKPERARGVLSLDHGPELLDRLHEASPLRPPRDEPGQDGLHRDRVGDPAAALGGVDLPEPGLLPEEVVGMSGIEMPFDPTSRRIRVLYHVEPEGERPDPDLVPHERMPGVDLDRLRADHPRIVAGMPSIVDEHRPHALRSRAHPADSGPAPGRLA